MLSASPDDLARFVLAQAPAFDTVCAELRASRKATHWMWFVFPQLRGLGHTSTSSFFGIASATEALAYWRHPLLGPRLKTCVDLLLAAPSGTTAQGIFGSPDDLKLRSSLTLFQHVVPQEPRFDAALARFYGGQADGRTLVLLSRSRQPPET